MSAPLVPIETPSIYPPGQAKKANVPARMARCTPDMRKAILKIGQDVRAAGGVFLLSDLFRSYDMQMQAHLDFVTGKKKAYSPAPVGSMHEAGRAFDVDLGSLKLPLQKFWDIAAKVGVVPIIAAPTSGADESWHFECRGSHEKVRQYYAAGKGNNMKAARAMAVSAVNACGLKVDQFPDQNALAIQSALIRLGQNIGNLDGKIGPTCRKAIDACGVNSTDNLTAVMAGLEDLLRQQFPREYDTSGVSFGINENIGDDSVFWENDEGSPTDHGGD